MLFFTIQFKERKSKRTMKKGKKMVRGMIAASLMLSMLSTTGTVANAKTYYNLKYGSGNLYHPWVSSSEKSYRKAIQDGLGISAMDSRYSDTKKFDYDGDGEKETVKLACDIDKKEYCITDLSLKVNGEDVPFDLNDKYSYLNVDFYTMELDGECFAFLLYGDEDFAGGGVTVYHWNEDDTLELVKDFHGKGYLGAHVAKEKGTGEKYLYFEDAVQITKKSVWPKKYKKWKKKKYSSVTKLTYRKYKFDNGCLKSKGKDVAYGIGPSYD